MKFFYLLIAVLAITYLFSFTSVFAIPCDNSVQITLCNPVEKPSGGTPGKSATNIVQLAVKIIYILGGFSTLLPIIAVTYSGFSMVIAQGNEEAISRAKTSLTWAVVGFMISILSFVIVGATLNLMGVTLPDPMAALSGKQSDVINPLGSQVNSFPAFVTGLLVNFLQFAGIVAVIFIVISGFRYILSAGNEEQARTAKTSLTWSIVGVVVILLSYVIIKATAAIFGM